MLFRRDGEKLGIIRETKFKLESELQRLIEQNMSSLFNIEFVKSEFTIGQFRLDTVGWDPASKSFVIVEYKRDKNRSVVDQGMEYRSLLHDNKAEFVLAFNETHQKFMRKADVDWSRSRVILVSHSFTERQKKASKDLPIELYEIKKYENEMVLLNPITRKMPPPPEPNPPTRTFTEEYHLRKSSPEIKALYEETKQVILSLDDDIKVISAKVSINFKVKRGFASIVLHKDHLKLYVHADLNAMDDPKKIMQDVSDVGHWGTGNARMRISPESDLQYVRGLMEQAYSMFKQMGNRHKSNRQSD